MPKLKAVKSFYALLSPILIWLLLWPSALAHTMPLELQLRLQTVGARQQLTLEAITPEGYGVRGARFEYLLTGLEPKTAQARASGELGENPPGSYQSEVATLPAGRYRFVLRDRTFEREVVEASTELRWPPQQPWRLKLPALGGGPDPALVLGFLGLPVLLGLGVLAWALWRKPPPTDEPPR
jgi:hypothetical protein